MSIRSIAQSASQVKIERSQNRADILALADIALAQARQFRAEYLVTGDGLAWRRSEACFADRETLLQEMGR